MKRVACFGSAVIDVTVKSRDFRVLKSHEVTGGVALCEVYGGKTEVDKISFAVGGAGTNVAVGLARLGLTSSPIVRVGRDLFGQLIIDSLKQESVDVSNVQISETGETGKSVILVAPDGGRSILTARGLSGEISGDEIDWEKLKTVDWIQISSLGGNMDLLENVISWAATENISVGWNPGKSELVEKERLIRLLPKIKLLVLNKMEATSLVGNHLSDDKKTAISLLEMGIKTVAITDGSIGAGVASEEMWIWADAFKVKSLDDTGAGDAFCSGLVAGILKDFSLEDSLKLGLSNGASEVMELGVKEGLMYENDIPKWMKRQTKIVEQKL